MTKGSEPLFRAYDRGIIVASIYASLLVACAEWFVLDGEPDELHAVAWAVIGFVAGAIAGFSNTDAADSLERDLKRNASDAGMTIVWAANLLLAMNLLERMASFLDLAPFFGWFAAATMLGAIVGEPILIVIASLPIRRWRPFLAANELGGLIHNPHARFVARLILHTGVVVLLLAIAAAIAFIVFIVVVVLVAAGLLYLVWQIITNRQRGSMRLGWGQKIAADGRIVKKGLLWDSPTGLKVDSRGRVNEEGLFHDRDTGMDIE